MTGFMKGFPGLPPGGGDPRTVAAVVNRMNLGKLNCTGEVTLAAGQPTTTVLDPRSSAASVILLMPASAGAAAELAAGGIYVSARDKGGFVITHATSAEADRRFGYAILG